MGEINKVRSRGLASVADISTMVAVRQQTSNRQETTAASKRPQAGGWQPQSKQEPAATGNRLGASAAIANQRGSLSDRAGLTVQSDC